MLQTSIQDPSKLIPLYATMGKLRLLASERTIKAAGAAMNKVIATYYMPKFDLNTRPPIDQNFDILRDFAESCRAELR